ncbi:KGK domain protein [Anabaena sp. UHCC 0253]|uniref:KGK domain-containing protein n=1 Tax=Anabaena sp. UHCC 0253 TaxID=2590019 RepID=UPI001445B232|nr:KGK domain-containing protein [Anabaena sp. UHCC 0253]MTJ52458.1 KGK domain protein [Anabaena sp. UHCC 0253]
MKIELNSQLENGNNDDVLDLGDSFLCKFGKFKESLISAISYNGLNFSDKINESLKGRGIQVKWLGVKWYDANWTEDVKCKILKINSKGWQDARFRIKISVEFEIDEPEIEEENTEIQEPESPLDDLRRKINDATS